MYMLAARVSIVAHAMVLCCSSDAVLPLCMVHSPHRCKLCRHTWNNIQYTSPPKKTARGQIVTLQSFLTWGVAFARICMLAARVFMLLQMVVLPVHSTRMPAKDTCKGMIIVHKSCFCGGPCRDTTYYRCILRPTLSLGQARR